MKVKYLNNLAEIIVSIDEGKNITDANIVSFTDRGLRLIGQMKRLGLDSGGNNVDVAGLAGHDYLGTSVALNAAGTLLAVGAYGDDGAGNIASSSGAVRLFSFTDGNFSGGSLQATIGKGYVGGNNIDVSNLESNDNFGTSVSLNSLGNSLAVGAIGDDGAGNLVTDSGAAYPLMLVQGLSL